MTPTPDWPDWREHAACKGTDPNLFFPDKGNQDNSEAKALCRECPAKLPRLAYALEAREVFGIWAGTTERERRRIRRRRRLAGLVGG